VPKKAQASAMEVCGGNPERSGEPEGERGETSTQEGAMTRTGYVAVCRALSTPPTGQLHLLLTEEGSQNRVSLLGRHLCQAGTKVWWSGGHSNVCPLRGREKGRSEVQLSPRASWGMGL